MLFLAFSLVLVFAIYGLRTVGDPSAYVQLDFYHKLMMGWTILLGYMLYYGKPGSGLDFDGNLSPQAIFGSIAALVALILISLFAVPMAQVPASLFYVPRLQLGPWFGGIVDEFCKQFFIVAHGEEVMRIAPALIFSMILKGTRLAKVRVDIGGFDLGRGDILMSGAIPSAFWAWFHSIKAYFDPSLLPAIFLAGMILFILTVKTRCILAAILTHAIYNTLALA